MSKQLSIRAAAAASVLTVVLPAGSALAHATCGNRVFPPTLTLDDPGVGDEASFPTVTTTPIPGGGNVTSIGYEWDKTITPTIGFGISGGYVIQNAPGADLSGWDNISVLLKGQLFCVPSAEFMASVGVERDFNDTGSSVLRNAGVIEDTSSTTPTFYFGKGFGDLSAGGLRPFAVTGNLGYQISDHPADAPNAFNAAFSLQYSLPYYSQHVKALPDFTSHLIPLVEVAWSTPDDGSPTTGTVAPGVLYLADTWQLGAEALIPINAATRQEQGVGAIVQFHLFLDDLLPNSLGKPLFGTKSG